MEECRRKGGYRRSFDIIVLNVRLREEAQGVLMLAAELLTLSHDQNVKELCINSCCLADLWEIFSLRE